MSKTPKRPRDPNQLAKLIIDIATGDARDTNENPLWPAERGKLGGEKGVRARADKVTAEERTAIARKAAIARWGQ